MAFFHINITFSLDRFLNIHKNMKTLEPPQKPKISHYYFLVLISCLEIHVEPIVWLPTNDVDLKNHYVGCKLSV